MVLITLKLDSIVPHPFIFHLHLLFCWHFYPKWIEYTWGLLSTPKYSTGIWTHNSPISSNTLTTEPLIPHKLRVIIVQPGMLDLKWALSSVRTKIQNSDAGTIQRIPKTCFKKKKVPQGPFASCVFLLGNLSLRGIQLLGYVELLKNKQKNLLGFPLHGRMFTIRSLLLPFDNKFKGNKCLY